MGFRGRAIWGCLDGRVQSMTFILVLMTLEQFCYGVLCSNKEEVEVDCSVSTNMGEFIGVLSKTRGMTSLD